MTSVPLSEYTDLLRRMIRIPSFSGEESGVADLLADFLRTRGVDTERTGNNLLARNRHFGPGKRTILLNSHIDTVKPNPGYTFDPFCGEEKDGKIYGLGSNDAGASVVSLLAVFLHYWNRPDLSCNLLLLLSAEEERSGKNGIESVLPVLGPVDFAIVGEPTGMRLAVAEKGLLVIDCTASGEAGHAARKEGVNAIYRAMDDIRWFREYRFPKISDTLGEMNMAVTILHAGTQHNVIPAECTFTVDIRVTDDYTHEEVLDIIEKNVRSRVQPRSMRLRSSSIPKDHPFVRACIGEGIELFGSPTLSDQALMPFPSVKIGPGQSARSHSADEYIGIDEIETGIDTYRHLLSKVL